MFHFARRPTRWTLVALVLYAGLLCESYFNGSHQIHQQRDVWFALPFALTPFLLATFVRCNRYVFGACFVLCLVYAMAESALLSPPAFDVNLLLFYDKVLPPAPHHYGPIESLVFVVALNCLVSFAFAATYFLAAKTFVNRAGSGG